MYRYRRANRPIAKFYNGDDPICHASKAVPVFPALTSPVPDEVVRKGIDPGPAKAQNFDLNPNSFIIVLMRKQAAIPIALSSNVRQPDTFS